MTQSSLLGEGRCFTHVCLTTADKNIRPTPGVFPFSSIFCDKNLQRNLVSVREGQRSATVREGAQWEGKAPGSPVVTSSGQGSLAGGAVLCCGALQPSTKHLHCFYVLFRLHDRKVCIIGLSVLMELPSRPAVLDAVAAQIVPSILLLFLGLKPLYAPHHGTKPDSLSQAREQDEDQDGKTNVAMGGSVFVHVYMYIGPT